MSISRFESARELIARNRERSALTESVKSRLKRIDALNGSINALIHVDLTGAVERAALLEKKRRVERGRLYGSLFSVKANIDVSGMPTSDGSTGSTVMADSNDPLVDLLIAEDAICIGKGNMAEHGKSTAFTDNVLFGPTLNPHNLKYSPGGSTGGDAAAVASGIVDFGVGGDSGGSIRVPAAYCGIYGILPTRGVISGDYSRYLGSVISRQFGSSGLLARTGEDLSLLFDVLTRYNPKNARSVPFRSPFNTSPRKKERFAYFSKLAGVSCSSEISSNLDKAVKNFVRLGFKAEEKSISQFEDSFEPYIVLAGQAALAEEDAVLSEAGTPKDLESEGWILKGLRAKIKSSLPPLTSERLLVQLHKADQLRSSASRIFEEFDFILSPVAACSAPAIGSDTFDVDGEKMESHFVYHFSRAVNLLGLPAIAFPTGLDTESRPIGLQIIGPRFSEPELLDLVQRCAELT